MHVLEIGEITPNDDEMQLLVVLDVVLGDRVAFVVENPEPQGNVVTRWHGPRVDIEGVPVLRHHQSARHGITVRRIPRTHVVGRHVLPVPGIGRFRPCSSGRSHRAHRRTDSDRCTEDGEQAEREPAHLDRRVFHRTSHDRPSHDRTSRAIASDASRTLASASGPPAAAACTTQ